MAHSATASDDLIQVAADGLARAADEHLDQPVARYPGWRVREVVLHTGSVHRRVASLVHARAREPNQREDWRGRVTDDALLGWFRDGVSELLGALAAPADVAVWYFGGLAPVDAWRQRMVHETVIHRWDVESASGRPATIPTGVAISGLHEAVGLNLVGLLTDPPLEEGLTLHLATTDAEAGSWLVHRSGRLELGEGEAPTGPAGCTIRGSAADLWLWTIGRRPLPDLEVSGARDAVEELTARIDALDTPAY
ncbi:MAG TPA: maleylpyruvate isomerase family mycothiol-dependent enzyme [Gemmatimonadales bacterium]|nr:maleylpyruvate isomerase family mycothiol-dependent enzyme [Gemmatimonadales bacterium]